MILQCFALIIMAVRMININIDNKSDFEKLIQKPRQYLKYAKAGKLEITYTYPEEYEAFVHALFIKNRRERITYIYDNACERIDRYNDSHCLNCSFHHGRCDAYINSRINGCCYHCLLQSNNGCPTKNLACKFFFCEKLDKLNHLRFEDFPEFKLLTSLQREIIRTNFYCKREVFLKLLFINSYLVFYIYASRNAVNMTIADIKNRRLEKST